MTPFTRRTANEQRRRVDESAARGVLRVPAKRKETTMSCGNLNYRPEPTGRDSTHDLSYEERELIANAANMRSMLELVYRPRGTSRMSVDERDSHEGYLMELSSWFSGLEELGRRLLLETYGPPSVSQADIERADEAVRISKLCAPPAPGASPLPADQGATSDERGL